MKKEVSLSILKRSEFEGSLGLKNPLSVVYFHPACTLQLPSGPVKYVLPIPTTVVSGG